MMKKIPYGMTDFEAIIKDGFYYVDKTMFIEKIEKQPPSARASRLPCWKPIMTLGMPIGSTNCSAICTSASIPHRDTTNFSS